MFVISLKKIKFEHFMVPIAIAFCFCVCVCVCVLPINTATIKVFELTKVDG